MPLTVVQILWVNIIMDTFAALAMASLPPNPAVMNEPPRPKDEFIITPAMARRSLPAERFSSAYCSVCCSTGVLRPASSVSNN